MEKDTARHIKIGLYALPMPQSMQRIRGLCTCNRTRAETDLFNQDESYTILINPDETPEQQAEAFLHECLHIFYEDFQSNRNIEVSLIEGTEHAEAEQIIKKLLQEDAI